MRKLWITVLLLSVSLAAVVAPMYAEGDLGVADKKTKKSTVTETHSSDVEDGHSSDVEDGEGNFFLKADPAVHKVHHSKNGKSKSATYSVKVTALSGFRGEVELSVEGLPQNSIAFFNPEEGRPKPVFASVLKIVVPPSAPTGTYTLTIIGASDDTIGYATVTLIVEGETTPSTVTTSVTTSVGNELEVSVATDEESYEAGDEVGISGYVKLDSGASAGGATVSLSVLNPGGDQVHVAAVQTNDAGRYSENFTLSTTAAQGTYTVYATASMTGYKDGFATVTFTVGVSDVPSVHIVDVSVAMLNGTLSSEFHPGETAVVWAVVNNTGADLVDGNTWLEVLDPDNSPITLVVVVVTIHTGEQQKVGVHVILGTDAKIGIYAVRILVSDRPIMAGGKFLDSEETAFVVASESGNNTTTTTTTQITSETTTSSSETTTTQTTSETTSTGTTETTTTTSTSESTTETTSTETTSETSTSTTETTTTTSTSETTTTESTSETSTNT